MQADKRPVAREAVEKQLLRFLCASAEDAMGRHTICDRLNKYPWLDADNQVLFETIRDLLLTVPREILLHLPAALTRRGFPDISCDLLETSMPISVAEAHALAETMMRESQQRNDG